jgi:ribosome recycling factor
VPSEGLSVAKQKMAHVMAALERDLQRIRTGAASASLVEAVHVDHHGRRARLIDVATITIPDPRQIVIVPWDPSSLRAVGTAISQSRIGLTPTVDGPAIRLYVPGMTEDRRRELVALVHKRADQARVELRSVRHEALASIRAREKQRALGADDVRREASRLQTLTDRYVAEVDRLGQSKEASILRL